MIVHIITTKKYPIGNTKFEDIISGDYITKQEWQEYFQPDSYSVTWLEYTSEEPLAIKYYRDRNSDMIFYVAPCMMQGYNDNGDYIPRLINAVKNDLFQRGIDDYQIFLIVHDKDVNFNGVKLVMRGCNADDRVKTDNAICGYFAFQHARETNKRYVLGDRNMNTEYDLFTEFISTLNDSNRFSVDVCSRLQDWLTTLGVVYP